MRFLAFRQQMSSSKKDYRSNYFSQQAAHERENPLETTTTNHIKIEDLASNSKIIQGVTFNALNPVDR